MGMIENDLAGMHQQHAAAQTSFNDMLRLVVLLESLPWLTASTLAAKDDKWLKNFDMAHLPEILVYVLIFSAVVGLVGLVILIHNRLNTIYYARAINGFRSIYAENITDLKKKTGLPLEISVPPARRFGDVMFLVVLMFAAINALYLGLAVYRITNGSCSWATSTSVLTFIITFLLYYMITETMAVKPLNKRLS